mmetsp:Transcript_13174/g.32163  ORF Transcript_13174/g.32163 Transcript_13174/m.32163 type:complete len:534 (+) Transcript_13174:3450-5051(+)
MRFVERDPDLGVVQRPDVRLVDFAHHFRNLRRRVGQRTDRHGVEDGRLEIHPVFGQQVPQQVREPTDPLRDLDEALFFVVHGVHGGAVREQHLGGADVGGRLVVPDVLLPRLQRQPVRLVALAVDGLADDPPRHFTQVLHVRREVRRRRPPGEHRHAEPLHVPHHHVGAHARRCFREHEIQGVRCDHQVPLVAVQVRRDGTVVLETAPGVRVLHQRADQIRRREVEVLHLPHHDLHLHVLRARLHRADGLQVRGVADEEGVLLLQVGHPHHHRQRLRRRGALVQQARVRDLHAAQLTHQRLEVHQRLQPALGDLRLVRRVRGVPGGILQQVAQNRGGHQRAVVAHAEEVLPRLVLRHQPLQARERLRLGPRGTRLLGQVGGQLAPDVLGDGLPDQLLQRRHADSLKHVGDLLLRRTDVPVGKGVCELQRFELGRVTHLRQSLRRILQKLVLPRLLVKWSRSVFCNGGNGGRRWGMEAPPLNQLRRLGVGVRTDDNSIFGRAVALLNSLLRDALHFATTYTSWRQENQCNPRSQ